MHISVCVLTVLLCIAECYSELTFCKVSAPDADSCLAKNIEAAMRFLKDGNSEFGLPPLDPFAVSSLTIDAGSAIQLVQYYTNLKVSGYSEGKVQQAHFDARKKVLKFTALYPKIVQAGHYVVNGNLMSLPINGEGVSTLELENTKIGHTIKFEEVTKDGQTYLKIKTYVADIEPAKMTTNYGNLFGGNKLLGDNMNKLINDEWQALYHDVKPSNDLQYAEKFKNYAQKFFDNVPAEKIFPN